MGCKYSGWRYCDANDDVEVDDAIDVEVDVGSAILADSSQGVI
jgi:hypothetical protein